MSPAINDDGLEAFELAPWEVDVASDDDWAAAASQALVTNGFCVLRGKCVSEELCERCGEAALSRLATLRWHRRRHVLRTRMLLARSESGRKPPSPPT